MTSPLSRTRQIVDASVRPLDYWLLIGTTVALCLLMVKPNALVVYALGGVCFLSPYSGLCLLAASQIVPDPPGMRFTIAQIAFFGFLVSLVHQNYRVQHLKEYALFVVPLTVWTIATDLIMRNRFYMPPILAYIIGGVGCLIISHRRVRTDIALLAICLGSFCSCLSWWGPQIGIEVAKTELHRAGLERLVAGRLAGVVGFPSAMASIGFLALSLWPNSVCSRGLTRWLLMGMSFATAVSVPGTLGRGAIAAIVLGYIVFFCLQHGRESLRHRRISERRYKVAGITLFVVAVASFLYTNSSTRTYLSAMTEFTGDQLEASEGITGYERIDKMFTMARLMLHYPGMGVPENEFLFTPVGNGTKWQLLDYQVPHNVFLGIGYSYGIPGLLIFGLMFFYTPVKILQQENAIEKKELNGCHAVFFVMFMFFPFGNFKTFYLLLAIELCWLRQTKTRLSPSKLALKPAMA